MTLSRRGFLQRSAAGLTLPFWLARAQAADGPDIHAGATPAPIPPGPFLPTWKSIRLHYKTPTWFGDAKFGIFIHWGLYAVPAYHNEWYARHMYGAFARWHTEHFGPPDKFGYKDFIPLFKAEKYDPDAWASLFRQSGARYVIPVAEHHDGFAMWDSKLTRWCAGKMGPKRDLIGDLAKSVRGQGLIFGLSSHRMEHHNFMYPTTKMKTDLFDPQNADFYGPPVPGDMNDGNASPAFQQDWLARCQELIDKYQPQMIYFDNGVNDRAYDSIKLRLAAYYYNRAAGWGTGTTLATKGTAYLAGSVLDFEKSVRGPRGILAGAWQIDDQIATNSWGYIKDIKYRSPASVLNELIDTVSKGGNLLLNISPKADGTIPDEQQQILRHVGQWLTTNGEAIYGTRPWTQFHDGLYHFTTKGDTLYAIARMSSGVPAAIPLSGKVQNVHLLGQNASLKFTQDAAGLIAPLPAGLSGNDPFVLKIDGLKLT